MLRKLTISILLLAVLLTTFSKSFVVGYYLLRKQHYAEVLCERKANLESSCKGSCQLRRQMKALEQGAYRQGSVPQRLVMCYQVELFHQTEGIFALQGEALKVSAPKSAGHLIPNGSAHSRAFDHPPEFISVCS